MKEKRVLLLYLSPADTSYLLEESNEYDLQRRPKLGLLYLSAVLKQRKGIQCDIWDQTVALFSIDDVAEAVDSGRYLFAGFYSAVSMEGKVIEFIRMLRERCRTRIPLLVGGPSFPNAADFLKAGCDIVCNGEGEDTICDIADHIAGSGRLDEIKGISYMSEGRVVKNEPRPLIEDVDSIPFPDHSRMDFGKYHDYYIFTMRKPYTTMITSRGCPYNCIFCDSHGIWGRRYRARSVENVLAEIDELVKRYGVRYIAFQDDVFGVDSGWADEFCRKLKGRKYDLKWMCILHPFSFRKDPRGMLKKLKGAGCDLISMGLQSAHPEILKRLNRHPDEPEHIKRLISAARSLDMLSIVGFIFGSPGETRDTIQTSIDFVMKARPNYVKFFNMVMLPGSQLAREYGMGARLCDFSAAEIESLNRSATRRFFLDPVNLARNIGFVLKHNPAWLAVGCRHFLNLRDSIGLSGKKGRA
ncbi:MAG: radical SAM protein [Candidatus Omnitrophota bacterium]